MLVRALVAAGVERGGWGGIKEPVDSLMGPPFLPVPGEMVRQARILAQATSDLVNAIKADAEGETDLENSRKLLSAAKILADATAKMVEAAKVSGVGGEECWLWPPAPSDYICSGLGRGQTAPGWDVVPRARFCAEPATFAMEWGSS